MVVAFVGCCHPEGDPNGSVSFNFTEREIPEHCKTTINVPVYLTHKHDLGPVGRIAKAWLENGKMMVAGIIRDNTPAGKIASEGVLNGELKGLSLAVIHGMLKNNSGKTTEILWKKIIDVSVCEEGDLPGTLIMTVAAKEAVGRVIENEKTGQPEVFSPYASFYAPRKQVDDLTKGSNLDQSTQGPRTYSTTPPPAPLSGGSFCRFLCCFCLCCVCVCGKEN